MKTKILSLVLAILITLTLFAGCDAETTNANVNPTKNAETQGNNNDTEENTTAPQDDDKVYTKEELLAMPQTDESYFKVDEVEGGVKIYSVDELENGILIIPNQIDGKDVVEIRNSAFFMSTDIKAVLIPETVIKIGAEAFKNCDELRCVYFKGENIKELGSECFVASNLKVIELPASLGEINDRLFLGVNYEKMEIIAPKGSGGEAYAKSIGVKVRHS